MKKENAAINPKAGIYEGMMDQLSTLKTRLQQFLMPTTADTLMIDPLTGEMKRPETGGTAEEKQQVEPYYYIYMHWYV